MAPESKPSMTTPPRFQYSLRSLLIVVTLCAVVLAVIKSIGMEIIVEFSGLAFSCAFVFLLALALIPLDKAVSRLPNCATLIGIPVLYCALPFVFYILGEAIDQPHPEYAEGNWLTRGVAAAGEFTLPIAVVMSVLVGIDAAMQRNRPRDNAYYPRLSSLRHGLDLLHVRLILIVGGTIIVGYYAMTVVEVWSSHQRQCGWVWPPKRVFDTCNFLWGLLWLADCASRPRRGTMVAAIGYLLLSLLMLPSGFGVLRE